VYQSQVYINLSERLDNVTPRVYTEYMKTFITLILCSPVLVTAVATAIVARSATK
jgi:hypothetical protein